MALRKSTTQQSNVNPPYDYTRPAHTQPVIKGARSSLPAESQGIPPSVSLIPPPPDKYSGGLSLIEQARALTIASEADYAIAGTLITATIDPQLAAIDSDFEEPTSLLYKAHRMFTGLRAKYRLPFEQARALLTDARKSYRRQQDELAAIEARRVAQDSADRAAAALRAEAQVMLAAGEEDEAGELLAEVESGIDPQRFMIPAKSAAATLRSSGESVRNTAKFRLKDPSKVNREYTMPDEKLIGARVVNTYKLVMDLVSLQKQIDIAVGIGAVEVYLDETESFRRK